MYLKWILVPLVVMGACADQSASHAQLDMLGEGDADVRGVVDAELPPFDDNCVPREGENCDAGCMPVRSSTESIGHVRCAVNGVFFGCVPSIETGFWSSDAGSIPLQIGVCDVLKSDTKQVLYCFDWPYGLYWYYEHPDVWCKGECPESPDAEVCMEER